MLGSEDAFRIFGKKVNEKVFLIRKYYSSPAQTIWTTIARKTNNNQAKAKHSLSFRP